jgi:sugar phosphate isomerase/epimerase
MPKPTPIPAALSLDGLRTDARDAFTLAADTGYRGIAFATNHAELSPELLGESARRHVRTMLAAKGLHIDAIRAAAPRSGMADPATIDRTIENVRKAMTLARELGVGTVAVNIGAVPGNDAAADAAKVPEGTLVSALRELAQQADAAGLTLAVGAEGTEKLASLLKRVDYDKARINLDSARAIAGGEDPLKLAETWGGLLGQFTAADAVRSGRSVRAAMLGEGQLPLSDLMEILREHGYRGPLVVDVRDLPDAAAGAGHAAEVLRKLLRR